MIEFQKITFKNFLSYGNTPTTYDFREGITRIKGKNGHGKSSCVVDTLYFALFGKTYRKKQKLEQLINCINKKQLEVSVQFRIREDTYIVERGLKPQFFRIFKNNELVEAPSTNRSYQEILEEEILHMNEDVFNQTVIKSMTKNISFLALTKAEKRKIGETVVGLQIFSELNKVAKDRFNDITYDIDNLKKEGQHLQNLIKQEVDNLENLKRIKKQVSEENEKKKEQAKEKIDVLQEKVDKLKLALEKIEKYKSKKKKLDDENTKIGSNIRQLETQVQGINSEILLAEKKIEVFRKACPDCPKVKEMGKEEDIDGKKDEAKKLQNQINELKSSLKETEEKTQKIQSIILNEYSVKSNLKESQAEIISLEQFINEEPKELIEIDESSLKKYKRDLKKKEKEYNDAVKKKKHIEVLRKLLADDGIKSYIIKKYLPHINKILNTYLQKFDADILFYFDEEFNEIIKNRHKEKFNYYSFSEGQKRRIDMAIMFTFLQFSKIKNRKSECNVIILDEITSGVDESGENMLYDVLKDIAHQEHKEIITMSQSRDIDPEKIDRIFDVQLIKGFSEIIDETK